MRRLGFWVLFVGALARAQVAPEPVADFAHQPQLPQSPIPACRSTAGGRDLLRITEPSVSTQVWISDGSANGTQRLLPSLPTEMSSDAVKVGEVGGKAIVFMASMFGSEPFATDGTAAGTVLLKDIVPGFGSSYADPSSASMGTQLLFVAATPDGTDELWKTDGTPNGTALVKDLNPAGHGAARVLCGLGSRVLFVGDDGSTGTELYETDGTAAKTALVKEFQAGTVSGVFTDVAVTLGGKCYFLADDGVSGVELWSSDGSAAGTERVTDIAAGASGTFFGPVVVWNGALYFVADNASSRQIYKSDGTPSGTVAVAPAVTYALYPTTGGIVFPYSDSAGAEPWRTDGTDAGTMLLRDINPTGSSSPQGFVPLGGELVFSATDGVEQKLFRTSGAADAGATEVTFGQPGRLEVDGYCGGNNRIYVRTPAGVQAASSANGPLTTLFRPSSGTRSSTTFRTAPVTTSDGMAFIGSGRLWFRDRLTGRVEPILDSGLSPSGLCRAGTNLYYAAADPVSLEPSVYELDGLALVPRKLNGAGVPAYLLGCNSQSVFYALKYSTYVAVANRTFGGSTYTYLNNTSDPVASSPRLVTEDLVFSVWTDLTTGGPKVALLKGGGSAVFTAPGTIAEAAPVGAGVVFNACAGSDCEPWFMDDGTTGPVQLKNIHPTGSSSPSRFASLGASTLFVADDGVVGRELWKTDGTASGTALVADLYPDAGSSEPEDLVAVGGKVIFHALHPTSGRELWASDGTPSGTALVRETVAGWNSSIRPGSLRPTGSFASFSAWDPIAGHELWRTDGTGAGTKLWYDVLPGATSSDPHPLGVADGLVLFNARHPSYGVEPWVASLDATRPLITPTVTGTAGKGGFYTSDVTLAFTVADPDSPVSADGCGPQTVTSDTAGVTFTCRARSAGGVAESTVTLRRDATPPTISCNGTTVPASSPAGAQVVFEEPVVSDQIDTNPQVRFSHPRGGLFPVGITEVTATAADEAGNTASCTFNVGVQDGDAPLIACPSDIYAQATDGKGAAVGFKALAMDYGDLAPTVSYTVEPGSVFAVGTTEVAAVATDKAGNSSRCTFNVIVTARSCGCSAVDPLSALALFAALGLWRRRIFRASSPPAARGTRPRRA